MSLNLDPRSQRELDRAVQKLADSAGETVKDVLPSQMRLFAADLAFNTRPIGKSPSDQKKGQEKVAARIGAIYKPAGSAYDWLKRKSVTLARAFSRMLTEKKFTEAAALLNKHMTGSARYSVGAFDDGRLHEKQQFANKVSECLIVIDFKKVERYSKEVQKRVGFAKGGFATAARQLGGVRGIPGFATRQKAPGTGVVSGDGKTLAVTLTNDVRHIDKALDKSGEERAVKSRTRAINLNLERQMNRKAKKASTSLK